ncbi:hypothetical protein [Desulfotomaculum copahuensis]|uniref:Uncharacterized protein n=1 Tax=Desulfotomaculum copahuensis TaxID=1838280 RepID=A0A1B7LHY3_9FIRM|nr:hypothetical protein [Desulfotomaculum copahuensis]OAT85794.1 hypothetical protein A6M21_04690 [Desulfotomaculum copahuensis]
MEQLEQARIKLEEASRLVREAADLSLTAMLQDTRHKAPVARLWEAFLGDFLYYVRLKGRQNRCNLFSLISFARIWHR